MSGAMNIEIPTEVAEQITQAAILEAIGPEARERMLAQAIKLLLDPQRDYQGRPVPSPLETAFKNALDRYAATYVQDYIEADPAFAAKIEEAVGVFRDSVPDIKYEDQLHQEMAAAIVRWALQRKDARDV